MFWSTLHNYIVVLCRLPFNWRTPIGYAIAVLLQCAAVYSMLFGTVVVLDFWLGSCWLFVEVAKDITNDLAHLNVNERANWNTPTLKWVFSDIVKLYLDAKQLSRWGVELKFKRLKNETLFICRLTDRFNEVYSVIITAYFLWARLGKSQILK